MSKLFKIIQNQASYKYLRTYFCSYASGYSIVNQLHLTRGTCRGTRMKWITLQDQVCERHVNRSVGCPVRIVLLEFRMSLARFCNNPLTGISPYYRQNLPYLPWWWLQSLVRTTRQFFEHFKPKSFLLQFPIDVLHHKINWHLVMGKGTTAYRWYKAYISGWPHVRTGNSWNWWSPGRFDQVTCFRRSAVQASFRRPQRAPSRHSYLS